jgi:hypothetical protein
VSVSGYSGQLPHVLVPPCLHSATIEEETHFTAQFHLNVPPVCRS